jgi:two-component system nitrogen regulation sensor histidine kinase NtrY
VNEDAPPSGTTPSRKWARQRGRVAVPWYGRLEWRITLALVALGVLSVGATSYLVQLTVRYFDAIGDRQVQVETEAIEIAQPFYKALTNAKREAFRARTRTLALELALEAPTNEAQWLSREIARHSDVFSVQLRRPDHPAILVEAQEVAGIRDWLRIPVEAPAVGRGVLQVEYAVDPSLDAAYPRLGELRRDVGKVDLTTVAEASGPVEREEVERAVVLALASASAMVLFIAIIAGLIIARQTTRKVTDLSAVMRRVARGELQARAPRLGGDELGQLATAFNGMLDDLEQARQRVAYLQRIGAWQDMARRIAHEIKNPLTPIQLAVQQIREKDPGGNEEFSKLLETSVEIVEDEIEGLRRMVGSFSQFSKVPEVQLEEVELGRLLEEFERAYGHLTDQEEDRLEVIGPETVVTILADRQLLKQVLVNLVENAVLSAREAGVSPVLVRVGSQVRNGRVELGIEDNGPGVDETRRDSIFEPYETTRERGTGLGLAIVKKIILDHGGEIRVEDSELGGAAFLVELPLPTT